MQSLRKYFPQNEQTGSRLKILQIFSRYEYYGGEEGSVYRIGDGLQKRYDVEYFLSSTKDFLGRPWPKKALIPLSVFWNREIGQHLERYQRIGKFDLWQIHNVFPAMSPIIYHKAFSWGIPIVHYLHNYRFGCVNGFFLDHGKPCQRCIHGNFVHAAIHKTWHESAIASGMLGAVISHTRRMGLFEKVARFIAISERQKEIHVEMGIPADKIEVVYHFYDKRIRAERYPANGHALFIGRLSPEKGILSLLEAWRMLARLDKKLVIAGEGPHLPELQAYVAKHNLTNVVFTGFIDAAAQRQLWSEAAFSVVPSIWEEPFGMVVLESWANSRPVIAHRIGALPELVIHGQNGLLADPFSPESLAQALAQAFAEPDLCRHMGEKGRLQLRAKYNRKEWLTQMTRIYQSLEIAHSSSYLFRRTIP